MLVTSSTIVPKPPAEPLLQWPIFTRKSLAGFARKLTDTHREHEAVLLNPITLLPKTAFDSTDTYR